MIYQFENRSKKDSFHTTIVFEGNRRCKRLRWWATGGVLGLFGAFAFPLVIGLLLDGSGSLAAAPDILRILSTISILSIIPLLVFGSYCLNQAVELSIQEPAGCSPRQLSYEVRFGKKSDLEGSDKDLSQFISLCVARLIVRTALRRRRIERAARLKLIKLAPGTTTETR